MNQWSAKRQMQCLALVFLSSALGCDVGPRMAAFDVTVQPRITHVAGVPASVEVNLVGVSDSDLNQWRDYPVNRYWSPKDPMRKSAYIMTFSSADHKAQTLSRSDPVWQEWQKRNDMHLFVIAFLPAIRPPADPKTDPRKLEFPLDRRQWEDVREIRILLTNFGLQANSSPQNP